MKTNFNLVRQFSVLSFVCIALITMLSTVVVSQFLTDKILLRDATVSNEFIQSIVNAEGTWHLFTQKQEEQPSSELESFSNHLAKLPDVVRANLYRVDRFVLWSSDFSLVGRHYKSNDELDRALSGIISYETGLVGQTDKLEHANLQPGLRFVETYLPIWNSDHTKVVGAVELYKVPSALNRMIVEGKWLVWTSSILGGVVLFASLFWIVRRASRTMEAQQRKLIESEALTMVGETASAVAHSMRNPLAAIRASAELTLSDDLDGAQESARDIIHETDRLDQWARDLLHFSKLDAGQLESIDMNHAITAVLDEEGAKNQRKRVAFERQISGPLPTVRANAAPIDQVLTNLITNTVEAAGDNGAVKVTTSLDSAKRQVVVEISDNGPGLSKAMSEPGGHLAERFGNLSDPALYLNRELSWLKFNRRVLGEARDPRAPLLERVKFLAIASSNLDEFNMKRIGGLKQQIDAGVTTLTIDGRTPRQQFLECASEIAAMQSAKARLYLEVMVELAKNGITVSEYSELTSAECEVLRSCYRENILPLITPLAMNSSHPFPFISNLSLNLLVALRHPGRSVPLLARVKIPIGADVPRFVQLGTAHRFVLIEDIMINNLDLLFPGLEVHSCDLFRVTRSANSESDRTDADDLLEMIESELRDRKFAPVVRLQTSEGIDPALRTMLALKLGLDQEEDVFETDIMVRMSDLMEIANIDIPSLHDVPHHPFDNAALDVDRSIFQSISDAGSILLQHPYESFVTSVERFAQEASRDPKVVAIKITLYRTSADTKIIEYLIDAARNGKQVAVVVELQARFDEAANIQWAGRLEEAGIHVNYGVLGLKTHCKVILVVRREKSGLRRYAHLGTGNYHAGTARLYSDSGMLTCDANLTNDLSELFNYLTTGWIASRDYRRILTAPLTIKTEMLAKIEREIDLHSELSPGLIRLKTNALEDPDITAALYSASQAGVTVELLVRDICRLRPGIPGLSGNITVISVIGRFLEHSRIYYFRNGGDAEFYIGSADLMTRNLERRVEVIAPVEDAAARRLLDEFLTTQLADQHNVWEMGPDGSYARRQPAGEGNEAGCQNAAIQAAARRVARSPWITESGVWKNEAISRSGVTQSRREKERGNV